MHVIAVALGWSLIVPVLAVSGDGSVPPSDPPPAAVSTDTAPGPRTTPRAAFDIVLGWLNGEPFTEAVYEATMDPTFVAAVPFEALVADLPDLVDQGPWTLASTLGTSTTSGAWEVAPAGGADTWSIQLEVDSRSGLVVGLQLSPMREFAEPADIEEATERLDALGTARFMVADVSDGTCRPLVGHAAGEPTALGSAFKLYVLGAVVAAVDAGTISWDTPVTIDDALDSLPSGTTQNDEPGTEVTVRELANRMISVSDNTATDHLIALVGRDAVEAMLPVMGNDAVEQNLPFLTTRELFIVKWGPDGLAERYAAANEAGRRAILADEVAGADLPSVTAVDPASPVLIDDIEWFASPMSLCSAIEWLASDDTARAVLAINPGLPDESGLWTEILFKGGSEPGVLTAVWRVEDAEGRAFVVAGGVTDAAGPIDEFEAISLLAYFRDHASTGADTDSSPATSGP